MIGRGTMPRGAEESLTRGGFQPRTFWCGSHRLVKNAQHRPVKVAAETALPDAQVAVAAMFENCIGCKWTLHVLAQIRAGVRRPGALARSKRGLTTKVLNERLAKLLGYGVLERRAFAEVPPRVEYHLTAFGTRFLELLDRVEDLRREFPGR